MEENVRPIDRIAALIREIEGRKPHSNAAATYRDLPALREMETLLARYLSEEGENIRNGVVMDMAHIRNSGMTISDYDCAIRVPHASDKISNGSEESDIALRNGARGATSLI